MPAVGSSRMIVWESMMKASRMESLRFIAPERWRTSLVLWGRRSTRFSHLEGAWLRERERERVKRIQNVRSFKIKLWWLAGWVWPHGVVVDDGGG